MNSTELLNEIKTQLELLKHKGYDKNSFKSGYLLGYAKALQLQQTGVVGRSEQLCDHPRSERSYIEQNMLRCNKCGKEFS